MGDFAKRLKKMGKAYAEAKEQGTSFSDVEAGKYLMQLQSAEITESMSGKLMIHREHLILEGKYKGEAVHDFMMVESDPGVLNEKGLPFIGRWLSLMGFEMPDKIEELEDVLAELTQASPVYQGIVKVSDEGYTNVRPQKALDHLPGGASDDEEEEEPEEDDEEPEAEEDEDDGDELSIEELVEFCEAQGLEFTEDDEVDELIENIKEYEWNAKDLEEAEVDLLEAIGAEVTKPKKKGKSKGKKK